MNWYRYYVSYAYNRKNNSSGFRNCTVERDCAIKSMDDIISISEGIEKQNDIKKGTVVIISYQLMSEFQKQSNESE